jgi:Flp pilus assembly secretin CpaC
MRLVSGVTLFVGAVLATLAGPHPSARAQDAPAPETRRLTRGMHDRMKFERDVARVAVGDEKILTTQVLNSRSILLLGKDTGRTSLLVWYSDETVQSFVVSVEPEYELLRSALHDIHPNITVEVAPDRAAVVLRGVVPDVSYSRAAEAAASAYLKTGRANAAPVVAAPAPPANGQGAAPAVVPQAQPGEDTAVINLLRVDQLPQTAEGRIQEAIARLGAPEVRVERLVRGESPDDAADVLLLKGKVQSQILLTRAINVASTMFLGTSATETDVQVGGDEGGGIPDLAKDANHTNTSSLSTLSGAAADTARATLDNAVASNLARAKLVSIGKGRILSMIEVSDVPQVRVTVRMYEVNRTELLQWAPRLTAIWSDFNQAALNPSPGAIRAQGANASQVGPTSEQDVQGVLSFLENGLTQQGQYASAHVAIDALFTILESRSIARALANPSITVLSGENANFQVGGEIPVPESFSPAFGSVATPAATTPGVYNSVAFRQFGVGLAVRPLVGDMGRITIDILTNVDQPDEALTTLIRDTTGTDPQTTAFQTRRIETTTRLDDGQSLMLGGLISRRATDDASFAPGIERIPGIGWLFKSFDIKDEDRELVIVISPAIVRDPIPDLGRWVHPDIAPSVRHWVDRMIEVARPKPQAAEPGEKKDDQAPKDAAKPQDPNAPKPATDTKTPTETKK